MSRLDALKRDLERIGPVRQQEPLSRHTTFGVGGPAELYAVARDTEELRQTVVLAAHHDVPWFLLGSGSNILVGDGGIRGLVVENRAAAVDGPQPLEDDGAYLLRAESGVSFSALARRLSRRGYAGLQWAVGIPGTLGGAVVYNAGAYGGSLADVLLSVRLTDAAGSERQAPARELRLAYRRSDFTRGPLGGHVVLGVELMLRAGDPAELAAVVTRFDEKRTSAQPPGRNAGSTFKNPKERPAWWLIDQVGLRGHRIGDAMVSEKHTNFFVNVGHARAADVWALIRLARDRVRERFGIELEPEVQLVGEGF